MTDLEKEMHEEYNSRPRTMRAVDDAIKAAAIVAERKISEYLNRSKEDAYWLQEGRRYI